RDLSQSRGLGDVYKRQAVFLSLAWVMALPISVLVVRISASVVCIVVRWGTTWLVIGTLETTLTG
ncbi:hypothetical protein, partial [Salmonella enterica]|uniref:hypothetical protein n=1 Tax=Salmonella enterica TaxID=28901 RepID=UPI001C12C0E6